MRSFEELPKAGTEDDALREANTHLGGDERGHYFYYLHLSLHYLSCDLLDLKQAFIKFLPVTAGRMKDNS